MHTHRHTYPAHPPAYSNDHNGIVKETKPNEGHHLLDDKSPQLILIGRSHGSWRQKGRQLSKWCGKQPHTTPPHQAVTCARMSSTADAPSSSASCWTRLRSSLCSLATSSWDRLVTTFFNCLSRSRASRLDLCATVLAAARPARRRSIRRIGEDPPGVSATGATRAQNMSLLPVLLRPQR